MALAPMVAIPSGDVAAIDDTYLLSPLLDGWRCLAVIDDRVRLRTRTGRDVSREVPEISAALARVQARTRATGGTTVLDGSLILPPESDRGPLPSLESATRYAIIDVLSYGGRDLTGVGLSSRRSALSALGLSEDEDRLEIVPFERGPAAAYLEQFVSAGHLGLLARKASSAYRPGSASPAWLAFARFRLVELVLCGIAARGSLVLGVPTPHGLAFAGLTWPTRHWADLALRCAPGEPPFPVPRIWGSLGEVAWSEPSLWVAVTPDVRPGSGSGGPRWRLVRVQEDLSVAPRPPRAGDEAASFDEASDE
jgi:bifunctional non-homologous end joining protein LigD